MCDIVLKRYKSIAVVVERSNLDAVFHIESVVIFSMPNALIFLLFVAYNTVLQMSKRFVHSTQHCVVHPLACWG